MRFWAVWLLVAAVSAAAGESSPEPSAPRPAASEAFAIPRVPRPGAAALAEAVTRALDYIARHCGADGQFVYIRHAPVAGVTAPRVRPEQYNMLRHAGAMFALAEGCFREQARATGKDPEAAADAAERLVRLRAAFRRATAYLSRSFGPVPDVPGGVAVWSERENGGGLPTSGHPEMREAKLGGAGLALIALCRMEQFESGASGVSLEGLRGLGTFVLSLQRGDGSFISKIDGRADPDDFDSLYYPGEAALGLAWLARIDPEPETAGRWRLAARKTLVYLATVRRDLAIKEIPTDHWALLATEAVLADWRPDLLTMVDRGDGSGRVCLPIHSPEHNDVRQHALRIVRKIFTELIVDTEDPYRDGAFRRDLTLCPVSIRLEGLYAARAALAGNNPRLRAEIDGAVNRGIGLLLRCQVATDDDLRGGVPRAARTFAPPVVQLPERALDQRTPEERARIEERVENLLKRETRRTDAFNRRVGEIRIDYVQHAVCAWMRAETATP